MKTKAYRTLSAALRADIEERFGDGEVFTSVDFYTLAEAHGKPHKSVPHILRDMATKKLLECVGEQANPHGGSMTKRYAIVPGAELTLKTVRDYQIEALRRKQNMNSAALRLNAILDNIARARMSA